jgi:Animal haem peroxidase
MLLEFKHGGHALTKSAEEEVTRPALKSLTISASQIGEDFDEDNMTPFRYLLDEVGPHDLLPISDQTVTALDNLGNAIVDQPADQGNPDSNIPPIFTYWSQFIDHELTARTDRTTEVSDITVDVPGLEPVDRNKVERDLLNRRTPAIELDAVYGDGPPGRYGNKARRAMGAAGLRLARRMRDGAKMRVGTAQVAERPDGNPAGPVPPPTNDLNRDLPRIGTLLALGVVREEDFPPDLRDSPTFHQRAFIADPRNDENLVVAQFHVAMLRFHNAVVDWLRFKDPRREERSEEELFEDSRRIVRWTFQWLVVNQFLKTLLRQDVVEKVLQDGAKLYHMRLREVRGPFMPVEFSVACYRFGHSMIRNGYDYNRNFGRKPDDTPGFIIPTASLNLLFRFTGKSPNPFNGTTQVLPHNWIIEWDRFDGKSPHEENPGSPVIPARVARKIDTHIAPTLGIMPNEGEAQPPDPPFEERVKTLLKHLARRNLRRGYQLSLPTGQAVARALEVSALSHEELSLNNSPAMTGALQDGGFLDRTPLWFYILKEAEVRENGQHLGEVGSRIVAETILGVMFADSESYLKRWPQWDPSQPTPGAGGPLKLSDGRTIQTIDDLLRFAGVLV